MHDRAADAIVERVSARAALAGNPSDGYGGAVLATPVDAYAATVAVHRADSWSVSDDLSGRRTFRGTDDLHRAVDDTARDRPHALVLATLGRFVDDAGVDLPPLSIEVTSTIPVSVGLAGSSAIVIGLLRALGRVTHSPAPNDLALATLALGVETDRLHITAGLQDRVVQAVGRPVLMRFDGPDHAACTADVVEPGAAFRLTVAHRVGLAEPSHIVHGDLRRRYDGGYDVVRAAMRQLARHALDAGDAFVAGDSRRLGDSMNATFDLRAEMIDLSRGHVEMIEAARAAGAAANFTGSGGAVIVLSHDAETERAVHQSLKSLGCDVVGVDVLAVDSRPGATGSAPAPGEPG